MSWPLESLDTESSKSSMPGLGLASALSIASTASTASIHIQRSPRTVTRLLYLGSVAMGLWILVYLGEFLVLFCVGQMDFSRGLAADVCHGARWGFGFEGRTELGRALGPLGMIRVHLSHLMSTTWFVFPRGFAFSLWWLDQHPNIIITSLVMING
jgi:hypothetical protein